MPDVPVCPNCGSSNLAPGTVFDPFAGLATTGLVALRLGRKFVGIELSDKYADMAEAKLATWWRRSRQVEPETPDGQAVLPLDTKPLWQLDQDDVDA